MEKYKALVVDDEESVCEAVKAILETEGIEVTTTLSSVDAVELVRKNQYDLLISDLKMPQLDGIQFYNKVRELGYAGNIIIMTAYGDLWSVRDALVSGVYDYILKPFTPDDVRIPVRQRLRLLRDRSAANGTMHEQTD